MIQPVPGDDYELVVLPLSFDYGLSQLTTAFKVGASAITSAMRWPVDTNLPSLFCATSFHQTSQSNFPLTSTGN